MKYIVMTCFLGILLIFGRTTLAYEVDTHEKISEAATNGSVLKTDSDVLLRVGLQLPIENDQQRFLNSDGRLRNILNLIKDGSRFEDTITIGRPSNHFYDPLSGQPLTIAGKAVGSTSPDWALEDKGQITGTLGFGKQEFSYRDAREYFYKALTQTSKQEREQNFGLTFQTIGMVIHHVQDMAQPQHVRNDQHLELPPPTGPVAIGFCKLSPILCGLYFAAQNPSLYEAYTNRTEVRSKLPMDFSLIGYDISSAQFTGTFNQPRKFWEFPTGVGLAQFTNANFVSAGTNFDTNIFNFR